MSDFFNMGRFSRYVVKTYRENARKYLLYTAMVFGAQMLWIALNALGNPRVTLVPRAIFSFIFIIFGILFVFSEMRPLRDRHTAPITGTFPASVFEKYLLILLNTTIVFTVVYLAMYLLTSLICSGVFGYGELSEYWMAKKNFNLWSIISQMTIMLFTFSPFAVFAGTMGMKNHIGAFALVLLIGVPLLGSPIYFPWFLNSNVLAEGIQLHSYFNGISETVTTGLTSVKYSTVPMFGNFIDKYSGNGYIFYFWALLLWVTGYFKLREKQIK